MSGEFYSKEIFVNNRVPIPKDPEEREILIANKLALVINMMVDLNNVERLRIIKAAQAFYGAWEKKNKI